ncbi:C2H2 type zinc finger domain containing protein [Pyrenophora teres f. teres]|uniref:C2H2 type zinc finger domain containing protein n=1 Tax=Pyrenophora teres f. teres TaxID=97479 RepID=A0A6S6VDE6_9PLEO|nr:C2H2 type zinc finger domain containing protein [Pyrenophora teres f. teres]
MYLHADLDIITRLAGRCGEEAAHRAYIALQQWSNSRDARTAVAHAGPSPTSRMRDYPLPQPRPRLLHHIPLYYGTTSTHRPN